MLCAARRAPGLQPFWRIILKIQPLWVCRFIGLTWGMDCWDKKRNRLSPLLCVVSCIARTNLLWRKQSTVLAIMGKWSSSIQLWRTMVVSTLPITPDMVVAMRQLVSKAHIVKPNYTEACLYRYSISTDPTRWWIAWPFIKQLHHMGLDMVIGDKRSIWNACGHRCLWWANRPLKNFIPLVPG